MTTLTKVTACQDNDSHWYVIPAELKDEFYRLLEIGENAEDEFIERFQQYMTDGDINNVQLWAEV